MDNEPNIDRLGIVIASLTVSILFCLVMYLYAAGYLPNAHR